MPKFCRHNRLVQNCPICSREQEIELRPIVSSSSRRAEERTRRAPTPTPRDRPRRSPSLSGVTVRHLRNAVDDGYRSSLVPGLKSSEEARRLADEVAFAATRLKLLAQDPPGLYGEVADPGIDLEERAWLAFLIAYIYPLEREDPFAAISAVRTSWVSGEHPSVEAIETGPRTAHDPAHGTRTLDAYRVWAQRAGSQTAAFGGEAGWTPERRFSRIFERLALPGMHRDMRFELLVSLGTLGVFELSAAALQLGGSDQVTAAAKRCLGIADPLLLERRATALSEACEVPLEALDLALFNWERGERASGGLGPGVEPDAAQLSPARGALDLY